MEARRDMTALEDVGKAVVALQQTVKQQGLVIDNLPSITTDLANWRGLVTKRLQELKDYLPRVVADEEPATDTRKAVQQLVELLQEHKGFFTVFRGMLREFSFYESPALSAKDTAIGAAKLGSEAYQAVFQAINQDEDPGAREEMLGVLVRLVALLTVMGVKPWEA